MAKGPGGELVARMLAAEGVDTVFGIIDGTYFGLYSSFPGVGIDLVSPRHETSAMHMAGAYARLTGRLGVAMASNGPGVANVLPGIAVENGEGNRVLLLTSSRRTGIGSPDRGGTYQYFDQVGGHPRDDQVVRARPLARPDPRDAAPRPAPVVARPARRGPPRHPRGRPQRQPARSTRPRSARPTPTGGPRACRRTRTWSPGPPGMLSEARQPLVHVGAGIFHAGAEAELARVAEALGAPVTTSWAGRGALPETSPHAIPMTAVELVDRVRNEADVVLTVGSRIGETDWWGKAPNWAPPSRQQHIQVDVDEEVLGLNKPVDLAILGDARETLAALAERLGDQDAQRMAERRRTLDGYRDAAMKDRAKLDKPLADARPPRAPRPRPDDRAAGAARGHRLGLRRRQHHRVGQLLPRGPHPPVDPVDLQVRDARGGHGPGARCPGRGPGPHGLLHHR